MQNGECKAVIPSLLLEFRVIFRSSGLTMGQVVQRSWAYLNVKKLLERADLEEDNAKSLNKRALQLALKV